jgi:hypothetical protein
MASTVHHGLPIHTHIKLNLILAKFLERRRRDVYPAISKSKIPFRASVTRALTREIFCCKRPFDDVLGPDPVIFSSNS